jgi:hypothetical protein
MMNFHNFGRFSDSLVVIQKPTAPLGQINFNPSRIQTLYLCNYFPFGSWSIFRNHSSIFIKIQRIPTRYLHHKSPPWSFFAFFLDDGLSVLQITHDLK